MDGHFKKNAWFLIFPCLLTALTATGAPIEDRVFGWSGEDGAYSIRETSDGGYILAGTTTRPGRDREFLVVKLTESLHPDPAFADGGWLVLGSTADDQAVDVIEVMDAEGRGTGFLAVGYAGGGDGDFSHVDYGGELDIALVRITPHGELARDFGSGGILLVGGSGDDDVLPHTNNYSEPGGRVLEVADGFVVAGMTRSEDGVFDVGTVGLRGGRDLALFKVDFSGRLASDFGDEGVLRMSTIAGNQPRQKRPNDQVFSLARFADGSFLATGFTLGKEFSLPDRTIQSRGNNDDQGINEEVGTYRYKMDGIAVRFDMNGRLVEDWGDSGIRFIGGTSQEKMYGAAITADGHVYLAGRTSSNDLDFARSGPLPEDFDAFLIRLDVSGDRDTSFGDAGAVIISGERDDHGLRPIALPDGTVLLLFYTLSSFGKPQPGGNNVGLARWSRSGSLEAMQVFYREGEQKPVAVILDSKQRLVIAGTSNLTTEVGDRGRLDASGRNIMIMRLDLAAIGAAR